MIEFDEEKIGNSVKPYDILNSKSNSILQFSIKPDNIERCIENAVEVQNKEIPVTPLSLYMLYDLTGNRTEYESKNAERINMLLQLAIGEKADGYKGKFIEKAMDVMWAILNEPTWVIPAHNASERGIHIAHEFGEYKTLDIFSAATGASVATAYFLLKDEFEKKIPGYFNERIIFELESRIIKPFLSDWYTAHSWKGLDNWYVNNWNPWIVSNVLTVILFAVEDLEARKKAVKRAIMYLKKYFNFTFPDAACVEGAGYFFASSASCFDIAQLLFALTDGETDYSNDEYLKKMMLYLPNMYAGNGYFFSMNDFGRRPQTERGSVPYFKRVSSFLGLNIYNQLAADIAETTPPVSVPSSMWYHPFRCFSDLSENYEKPSCDKLVPQSSYMESVQIMTARTKDFTVFCKGGNNHEPHGHNDVGEFTLYYKNKPLFIDPAVENYTAATFGDKRQGKWTMRSVYHNTPILNGHEQEAGYQGHPDIRYKATDVVCNLEKLSLISELKAAYPEDSGILTASRNVTVGDNRLSVEDKFSFSNDGEYTFNLISTAKPEKTEDGIVFLSSGDKILCRFNSDCDINIEEIPLHDRQVKLVWNQDVLYRTQFSMYCKNGDFHFIVEKQ